MMTESRDKMMESKDKTLFIVDYMLHANMQWTTTCDVSQYYLQGTTTYDMLQYYLVIVLSVLVVMRAVLFVGKC